MGGKILWGRLLRRGFALFLATLALWALLMGTGGGTATEVFSALGESSSFVAAALGLELGYRAPGTGPMAGLTGWDRLVLRQSALLRTEFGPTSTPSPSPSATLPPGQPAHDRDDLVEPPATTAAPSSIVPRTLIPTGTEGYVYADGLYLYNRSSLPVDLAAAAAAELTLTLPQEGPQILIMHTHGTEAYTPDGTDVYTPSDNNSRTLDTGYNMIRVGEEMARVFTEMGLEVIQDKSMYDYPQYNGAYDRSGAVVQTYLQKYPSIRIVLDVHRDALVGADGTVYKAVTNIDGVPTAQVMLVLGSSEGGGHPNWTKNLTLATKIQRSLDTLYPTLARPMTLRVSKYNQDLSEGALLVEVGTHGNTLQESLAGARLFARGAGQVLLGQMAG